MKVRFTLFKKHIKLDTGVQFDAYKIKTQAGEWRDVRLVKDAKKLKGADLPAVIEVETADCFVTGKTVEGKHYTMLCICDGEYIEKAQQDDRQVLAFLGATEKEELPY